MGKSFGKLILYSAISFWILVAVLILIVFSNRKNVPKVLGASYNPSLPILIYDEKKQISGASNAEDVYQILDELGVEIWDEDIIQYFPDPKMRRGTQITIQRAPVFNIVDAGHAKEIRSWKETIEEMLDEKGIKISEQDRVEPATNTVLFEAMTIKITRISGEIITETEIIPYEVVEKEDPELLIGIKKVMLQGKKGKKELSYRITLENGVLVKKEFVSEKIIEKPKNKIVVVGTKRPLLGKGTATWYQAPSGTCAHRTLSMGTVVLVTNLSNGKQATCRVADRGPFTKDLIDLSPDVFSQLAPLGAGRISVKLEKY